MLIPVIINKFSNFTVQIPLTVAISHDKNAIAVQEDFLCAHEFIFTAFLHEKNSIK